MTDGSTVTVSEMVYNTSGDLITSVIGSGTRTVDSTTNFITEEFTNSVTGKIETIVTDPSTGKEVTEISTGVGAGRVVETTTTIETNANGLPTTKIENADGSRVELFTNEQGVTEETRIDADNKITVIEKGVNDDGSTFQNIVATGTASTGTNNEEIFALTTSDNVAIVRTVLQSGAESIVATDPFGVVNTVGISATGTVTQTFEKDGAVIDGDQFSGPAGIGFDENLLVGDEEHENDGPPQMTMNSSMSASANANLSFEWTSGENLTLDEVFISYDIA